MEAFKIIFLVTDSEGRKIVMTNKAFAATGYEATEKIKHYLQQQGHAKMIFLKWKVLNPFQVHFK
jgi:hypothetical protein